MSARCSASSVLQQKREAFSILFPSTILFIFPQVVNVLRSQLNQLDEVKRERETLEQQIKDSTFDMQVTFLTALAQSGAINEEQLSMAQLDQQYGGYNQRVQASLHKQEELLGLVQVSGMVGGSEVSGASLDSRAVLIRYRVQI